MTKHLMMAVLGLFFVACASHHRDVASVENRDENPTSGRAEHAVLDATGARGSHIR